MSIILLSDTRFRMGQYVNKTGETSIYWNACCNIASCRYTCIGRTACNTTCIGSTCICATTSSSTVVCRTTSITYTSIGYTPICTTNSIRGQPANGQASAPQEAKFEEPLYTFPKYFAIIKTPFLRLFCF